MTRDPLLRYIKEEQLARVTRNIPTTHKIRSYAIIYKHPAFCYFVFHFDCSLSQHCTNIEYYKCALWGKSLIFLLAKCSSNNGAKIHQKRTFKIGFKYHKR